MNATPSSLLDGFEHVETAADFARGLTLGRPLRVKLGIDPTSPDLHLGFMVVLHKLQRFAEAGHDVTLIIGDFTARIGDPSGRNVDASAADARRDRSQHADYREQAGKVLDLERIKIRYNSEWLDKLNFADVVKLLAKTTVAQMLERNDFHDRYGRRHADLAARVSLSRRASVRFGRDRGRRGARRNRSALQLAAGAPVSARVRPAAADLRDRAAARRARRREEDEQVARQLRRRRRARRRRSSES